MLKNSYMKLVQLTEYMKCPVMVFIDDARPQYFSTLDSFIIAIQDKKIDYIIQDFDSYNISFISVQESLFNQEDKIVNIYLI